MEILNKWGMIIGTVTIVIALIFTLTTDEVFCQDFDMTIDTSHGTYSQVKSIIYHSDTDTIEFRTKDGVIHTYLTSEVVITSIFGQVIFDDNTPILLHYGYGISVGLTGETTTITGEEIAQSYFTAWETEMKK